MNFLSTKLQISVVICTYNRSQLLKTMLDSLCQQDLESSRFEVIVVDNNSTDDTRQIVEGYRLRLLQMRYILEGKQGLSNARNLGWHEARGAFVAYVDDDCIVPAQWLSKAFEIIDRISPQVFGGPYYAFYNSPKPRWFKDEYGSNKPFDAASFLSPNEYLTGGNLFISRAMLEQTGGFPIDMGMKGSHIAYGEETVLLNKIRKDFPDAKIYYDPELFVYHLVRPKKMQLSWLVRQRFAEGRYGFLTFNNGKRQIKPAHLLGLVGVPIIILFETFLGTFMRNRHRYPYWENYFYERIFNRIATFGKLYERLMYFILPGKKIETRDNHV